MQLPPTIGNESERLSTLHEYRLLDTLPEAAFDELVALAAQVCGTPVSLVSLVGRDRQWFKAKVGIEACETPRSVSFCAHAIARPDEIFLVPDATRDPRFADNPLVTGPLGLRFYAGVPLKMATGHAIGSLCVVDTRPRQLEAAQLEALRIIAHQVVSQIELRQTLGMIHAEEERYRLLFDASPTPIVVYHVDSLAILATNRAAESAYGYTRAEFRHLLKSDLRPAADFADLMALNAQTAPEYHAPRLWRHRRKDGTIFPVSLHSHAITFNGDRARLVHAIDMTEHERATAAVRTNEERFQLVAEATHDSLWDLDVVKQKLWWSPSFHALAGTTPAVTRAQWLDRVHPDDREQVASTFAAALAGDHTLWTAEYRFRHAAGHYVTLVDRGRILRDAHGHATRVIGAASDITERKAIEAQYLRAQRLESIGTLAGGIAHDLNNVLTPILMSIGLLKDAVRPNPDHLDLLDGIETSAQRGASLVRQVLSFSRGISGERGLVNLRHLLIEVERIARETFPRSLKVAVNCPSDLWTVPGDTTQLHQLLMNLAVNARDAMPDGGDLTLSAANLVVDAQLAGTGLGISPGPYVLVQITDTGEGIDAAIIERIFEPFFTTKTIGQGTGLGLSTVHAIAKSHGGTVQAASELRVGSTFKVYLPAEVAPGTARSASDDVHALPRGQGEHVLVIDDESTIRSITQQTLEAHGYRVLTAANGAEGVALFATRSAEIAAVIVDMMMPVMDGPATIHALLHLDPKVRLIAASGLNSQSHVAKATLAGISDFLPKPYTAETLLTLLRIVLNRPSIG